MADVPAEMAAAAREFAAEENADAKKLEKKLEQLDAPAAAPGAAQTEAPPAAEPAAAPPAAAPPVAATLKLCKGLLTVADRFVVAYTTPELKLEPDELEQLAAAAVPVIEKNLPELIQKLASTPEGQFVLVAAMIYGSKLPALLAAKPAANDKQKTAEAAPSSPPAEATQGAAA